MVRQGMFARIDHNELGPVQNRILNECGRYRMSLGHIGSDHQEHFSPGEFIERIGHCT
jgi:hypothetical protein